MKLLLGDAKFFEAGEDGFAGQCVFVELGGLGHPSGKGTFAMAGEGELGDDTGVVFEGNAGDFDEANVRFSGGCPSIVDGGRSRALLSGFDGLGELSGGGLVVELFALLDACGCVGVGAESGKDDGIVKGVVDGNLGLMKAAVDTLISGHGGKVDASV